MFTNIIRNTYFSDRTDGLVQLYQCPVYKAADHDRHHADFADMFIIDYLAGQILSFSFNLYKVIDWLHRF